MRQRRSRAQRHRSGPRDGRDVSVRAGAPATPTFGLDRPKRPRKPGSRRQVHLPPARRAWRNRSGDGAGCDSDRGCGAHAAERSARLHPDAQRTKRPVSSRRCRQHPLMEGRSLEVAPTPESAEVEAAGLVPDRQGGCRQEFCASRASRASALRHSIRHRIDARCDRRWALSRSSFV
jgi:hypothetical protein